MRAKTIIGDCRDILPTLDAGSVQTCVTSPPYFGLRDYGVAEQIGLESTVDAYVTELVAVFREVRRVLRDDGTLWLNLGDSYNNFRTQMGPGQAVHGRNELRGKCGVTDRGRGDPSLKEKDLIGVPWRVAFALQSDGWYLRQDIIWSKPNPMPESVRDRCTKSHEYLFLLSKQHRYFYDAAAIAEPAIEGFDLGLLRGKNAGGDTAQHVAWHAESIRTRQEDGVDSRTANPSGKRNKRSVWTVATQPFKGAHFATFPPKLIEPCILAGSREGDTVLDPFGGSGTTGEVATRLGRNSIIIELNPAYLPMIERRTAQTGLEIAL